MQHRNPQPLLRGYGSGEDGGGRDHVAEVNLCDIWEMVQLSHVRRLRDGTPWKGLHSVSAAHCE